MSAFLSGSTIDGRCILTADAGATFETVESLKLAIRDQRGMHGFFQLRLILGVRILDDNIHLAALGGPPLRINLVMLPYKEDDKSRRALADAIDNGMLDEARRLLQLPIEPNIRAVTGLRSTPMFNAALRGDSGAADQGECKSECPLRFQRRRRGGRHVCGEHTSTCSGAVPRRCRGPDTVLRTCRQ